MGRFTGIISKTPTDQSVRSRSIGGTRRPGRGHRLTRTAEQIIDCLHLCVCVCVSSCQPPCRSRFPRLLRDAPTQDGNRATDPYFARQMRSQYPSPAHQQKGGVFKLLEADTHSICNSTIDSNHQVYRTASNKRSRNRTKIQLIQSDIARRNSGVGHR